MIRPFVLRQRLPIDRAAVPATAALVDAWSRALPRRRLADASAATLRRGIRPWLHHLAAVACCDAPDAAVVDAYLAAMAARHRAATVALYRAAVRDLYRWAAAAGRGRDIAAAAPAGGGADPDAPLPPLRAAQFARVLRGIAGSDLRARRDRALLACLRAVPAESIAWARARIADADPAAQTADLRGRGLPSAGRRGPAPARRFALDARAAVLLADYLAARGDARPDAPLFASTRGGGALSTLSMRLLVLRCLQAAGLRGPSPGVERSRLLLRYPPLSRRDLAGLPARLPRAAAERDRLRALLHLLALPGARIAWERLRWEQVRLRDGCIRVRRGSRGGAVEDAVSIDGATVAALRAWRRRGADGPVFPAADGGPSSHHALRRLAWSAFPERQPAATGRPAPGSTRRISPARTAAATPRA